jgi:hypothetical protein
MEYLPLPDFYALNRKGKTRLDILGVSRASYCPKCANKQYIDLDAREKIFRSAKARAKKKGREFSITVEDVVIPDKCPVLGIPLRCATGEGPIGGSNNWNAPTLDRINNCKGYIVGNVAVISRKANTLKWNGTPEELAAVATYVAKAAMGEYDGSALEVPFIQSQTIYNPKHERPYRTP